MSHQRKYRQFSSSLLGRLSNHVIVFLAIADQRRRSSVLNAPPPRAAPAALVDQCPLPAAPSAAFRLGLVRPRLPLSAQRQRQAQKVLDQGRLLQSAAKGAGETLSNSEIHHQTGSASIGGLPRPDRRSGEERQRDARLHEAAQRESIIFLMRSQFIFKIARSV